MRGKQAWTKAARALRGREKIIQTNQDRATGGRQARAAEFVRASFKQNTDARALFVDEVLHHRDILAGEILAWVDTWVFGSYLLHVFERPVGGELVVGEGRDGEAINSEEDRPIGLNPPDAGGIDCLRQRSEGRRDGLSYLTPHGEIEVEDGAGNQRRERFIGVDK